MLNNITDNKAVVKDFSLAASSYSAFSSIQMESALVLVSMLDDVFSGEGIVVDLGCGDGKIVRLLRKKYPFVCTIGVDASVEMLKEARKLGGIDYLLCSGIDDDFWCEGLKKKVCLVISGSALHWSRDLSSIFKRMDFVLKEGGVFAFCFFGPNGLRYLSQAFGMSLAVQGFCPLCKVERVCNLFFDVIKFEVRRFERRYNTLRDLLLEFRNTGVRAGRRFFLSAGRFRKAESWFYNKFGYVVADYEVGFFVCRKR